MTPDERDRDESGKFTDDTKYSRGDFLAAVDELEDPTTSDIAYRVGSSRSTARAWLRQLEDAGVVSCTQIGPAKVWDRD